MHVFLVFQHLIATGKEFHLCFLDFCGILSNLCYTLLRETKAAEVLTIGSDKTVNHRLIFSLCCNSHLPCHSTGCHSIGWCPAHTKTWNQTEQRTVAQRMQVFEGGIHLVGSGHLLQHLKTLVKQGLVFAVVAQRLVCQTA